MGTALLAAIVLVLLLVELVMIPAQVRHCLQLQELQLNVSFVLGAMPAAAATA